MISNLNTTQVELDKFSKSLTEQVSNTSNVANNLNDRFDYECVSLTQDFLQKMKNDKLVFYFNKKFLRKPKVLITIKSLKLIQPKDECSFKFSYDVKEQNIEQTYFKFSIEQKSNKQNSPINEIDLESAEICYLAFEELQTTIAP